MSSIPVKESEFQENPRTITEKDIKIHNINPSFPTAEARETKAKEISQTLYSVFSKYQ